MRRCADAVLERLGRRGRVQQAGDEVVLLAYKRVQRVRRKANLLGQRAQQLEDNAVAGVEEADQAGAHGLRRRVREPLVRLGGVVVAIHAEELFDVRGGGVVGELGRIGVTLAGTAAFVELAKDLGLFGKGLGEEGLGLGEERVDGGLADSRVLQVGESGVAQGGE